MNRYYRTKDVMFILDAIRTLTRSDNYSRGFHIFIGYKGIHNINLDFTTREERDLEFDKICAELEKRNNRGAKQNDSKRIT